MTARDDGGRSAAGVLRGPWPPLLASATLGEYGVMPHPEDPEAAEPVRLLGRPEERQGFLVVEVESLLSSARVLVLAGQIKPCGREFAYHLAGIMSGVWTGWIDKRVGRA